MLTISFILLYSVVCYLAALGIQEKLLREGGPLDFVGNWIHGSRLENTRFHVLLMGCEVCLGGQIFLWSWWLLFGFSWWLVIGTLTCVGMGYVIREKFIYKEG